MWERAIREFAGLDGSGATDQAAGEQAALIREVDDPIPVEEAGRGYVTSSASVPSTASNAAMKSSMKSCTTSPALFAAVISPTPWPT
jgi:hypothetical protein